MNKAPDRPTVEPPKSRKVNFAMARIFLDLFNEENSQRYLRGKYVYHHKGKPQRQHRIWTQRQMLEMAFRSLERREAEARVHFKTQHALASIALASEEASKTIAVMSDALSKIPEFFNAHNSDDSGRGCAGSGHRVADPDHLQG